MSPHFIQHLQTGLQIAVPVGAFLASLIFTFFKLTMRFVKSQTTNGDGRSLRRAVDDLAQDFAEHRHEMRRELGDMKVSLQLAQDRIMGLENRTGTAPSRVQ